MKSTPPLSSLPGPLWPEMVTPHRALSIGQIEVNCVWMLNWIAWNRTIYMYKMKWINRTVYLYEDGFNIKIPTMVDMPKQSKPNQIILRDINDFLYTVHHHHHVALVARISLTLSHHSSLSFIARGRSSGQHPVSSHSCWMYVRAGRPAFARPCVGVHKSTSLMSSSLLLQHS